MKIRIDHRGVIASDGSGTDHECVIDMPIRVQRDCTYSSGSNIVHEDPSKGSITIKAGPGIILTTGSYGDYTISLQEAPSTSTVWRDIVTGSIDSSNRTFTLAGTPNPPESIMLFRNGLVMLLGSDFTLYDSTITFQAGNAPSSGSTVWARYQA